MNATPAGRYRGVCCPKCHVPARFAGLFRSAYWFRCILCGAEFVGFPRTRKEGS